MKWRVALGALAICGSMMGTAAKAEPYSGEATLVTAVEIASETVIDGVTWRCEGTRCVGRSNRAKREPQMRECRKLVVALGPLASFRSRGRPMSDEALAECNRLSARD